MKTWIKSLGDAMAVARANMRGCTVGKVDIAPFEIEYGRGHKRIMHSSLSPSCLRVNDSAANRLSCDISRWTNFERMVLETMKEHKEPIMVAEATMNHLGREKSVLVLE